MALEDIRQIRFSDMGENDSACDAARYMAARAVMQGVDRDRFDPHALVTRAELVTMLRRMAADDAEPVGSLPAYSDVTEDDWFADAVAWAFHAGIATGNADGSFAPRRTVTRTELAVMLSRFAGRGAWTRPPPVTCPSGRTAPACPLTPLRLCRGRWSGACWDPW